MSFECCLFSFLYRKSTIRRLFGELLTVVIWYQIPNPVHFPTFCFLCFLKLQMDISSKTPLRHAYVVPMGQHGNNEYASRATPLQFFCPMPLSYTNCIVHLFRAGTFFNFVTVLPFCRFVCKLIFRAFQLGFSKLPRRI